MAHPDQSFGLVLIPSKKIARFQSIPGPGHQFIYLDDIIKFNITQLFPNQPVTGGEAIKRSWEAERYLEDDPGDRGEGATGLLSLRGGRGRLSARRDQPRATHAGEGLMPLAYVRSGSA